MATANSFDYLEDSGKAPASEVSLKTISELVSQAIAAEKELAAAEEVRKIKSDAVKRLLEDLIPSAMERAGMEKFTTTDGFSVKIKKDLSHSLSADRREAGMEWLEANGQGGIIKREITLSFAKGQEVLAAKVAEEIKNGHPEVPVSSERNVASMTLKSVLKGMMEKGVAVPVDIFKIAEVKKAIID